MWTCNRRVPLGVLIHQSFLRDRISLCSSGWLGTLCRDLPASASWILGLETCTTIPGLFLQSWHVTKQRRLKESSGLLLPSSLLPQEALILKSSEKQALRGPCGDERQWPSRGLMGFSWYKCKFRAASSQGAMLAFSGRISKWNICIWEKKRRKNNHGDATPDLLLYWVTKRLPLWYWVDSVYSGDSRSPFEQIQNQPNPNLASE